MDGMRHVDFDSEFFGMNVVRVDHPTEHVPADTDVVCCLIDSDNILACQRAETAGYKMMDVRVTLERQTAPFGSSARLFREEDIDALVRIARSAHRITRFYADPHFPDARCDDLYETWIRKSCEGWAERVLVVGPPSGYITVHLDDDSKASIGLIAVCETDREAGKGKELVQAAVDFAYSRGREQMTVVTQGRNINAQRVFQSCGFRTCKTEVWFHK
jgi:dTDP-4-amino-4,6-dideoxy-D-galactose acyltransferase